MEHRRTAEKTNKATLRSSEGIHKMENHRVTLDLLFEHYYFELFVLTVRGLAHRVN